MSRSIETEPGVAGALRRAVERVRERGGDAVAVLVPSEANGVLARLSLAAGGPFLNVQFVTPEALVRQLALLRVVDSGRRLPPSGWLQATLAARLPELAASGALERHGRTLCAPGWIPEISATIERLEGAGVDAALLREAAGSYNEPERCTLLAMLLEELAAAREADGLLGPAELHALALEGLADALPVNRIAGWVMLGDRMLAPGVQRVLQAWCAVRSGVRLAPPSLEAAEPAPSGMRIAAGGAPLIGLAPEGATALARLARGASGAFDETLRIVSAADEVREMVEVAREVQAAVRDGVPLDRIAVALPSPDTAEVLRGALDAAGIPATWFVTPPLSRSPSARFLQLVLGLADSQSLVEWHELLRQPGLRLRGAEGRGRWRRILAGCGAASGARSLLRAIAEWGASREADDRKAAASLARSIRRLQREIEGLRRSRTLGEHGRSWKALLAAWWRLSEDHAALGRLLDGWGAGGVGPRLSLPDAAAALALALEAAQVPEGRLTEPKVRVLPPMALLGGRFERVIVAGLCQGRFPVAPRESVLLPDALIEHLERGLATSRAIENRERRRLASAIAACEGRLLLSYPRNELSAARPLVPGTLLLEVAGTLEGRPVGYAELAQRCEPIPGRSRLAPEDPEQAVGRTEHLIARIVADPPSGLAALAGHPIARRLLQLQRSIDRFRQGLAPDEWSGLAGPDLVAVLDPAEPVTPWRLAQAVLRPDRFFLRQVLGARPAPALPGPFDPLERRTRGRLARNGLEQALSRIGGSLRERFVAVWDELVAHELRHQPAPAATRLEAARALALSEFEAILAGAPQLDCALPADAEGRPLPSPLPWTLAGPAGLRSESVLFDLSDGETRKKLSFLDSAGLVYQALALGDVQELRRLSPKGAGAAPLEQLAGDALRAAQTLERCVEHGFWPATGKGTELSLEREAKLALLDRDALEQILEGIER